MDLVRNRRSSDLMNRIDNLKIKLIADGADFDGMVAMRKNT